MAAMNDLFCHIQEGASGEPLLAGGKRGATTTATMVSLAAAAAALIEVPTSVDADVVGPATKKTKLHHAPSSFLEQPAKTTTSTGASYGERCGRLVRLPSPTDVLDAAADPSMMTMAVAGLMSSQQPLRPEAARPQIPLLEEKKKRSRIKKLPPTLSGITDAARVLHTSKLADAAGGNTNRTPLLLSFPTESVYMLACCVKTASSRSVRKLLSRVDSQTSLSSGNSVSSYQDSSVNQGSGASINHVVHPPNASLEWMLKCSGRLASPTLFVLDGPHALNFCCFTKPKTFAIRPPSLAAGSNYSSTNRIPTPPEAPSFAPLPTFGSTAPQENSAGQENDPSQAARTLDRAIGATNRAIAPNVHKLQAANFSESREAFLRLASKFWPGPVTIRVRARALGEEQQALASHSSQKSSASSLVSDGSSNCAGIDASAAGVVPVLPTSALVPSREEEEGPSFVEMQCPSHPLSRRILNEVYRGAASDAASRASPVPHSSSVDSLASVSSTDENATGESSTGSTTRTKASSSRRNCRAPSNVAVVGCTVPGPPSSADACATTAVDAARTMIGALRSSAPVDRREGDDLGRIFIVDGEDNRESFSVPTCQYGRPPPLSLVVDGDERTVRLIRRGPATKEAAITVGSVRRALLKPASRNAVKVNGGDSPNIDRVVTAVLSRWSIQDIVA